MTLYEDVVAAVRERHGIDAHDDVAFAEHLATLVPSLHALRTSYRTGLDGVRVEYPREATEAYLLAYYPHYAQMARSALALLPDAAWPAATTLRVVIFGSGPTPEAPGIAKQLLKRRAGVKSLELALFDLQPDTWAWARDVSLTDVLPRHWHGETQVVVGRPVDISAPGFLDGTAALAVNQADLVVFQNCLNELTADVHAMRDNATTMVENMRSGALLSMADIGNYPNARRALNTYREAASNVDVLHEPDVQLALPVAPGLPEVVRTNLFVGGEYPRRHPFEWRCFLARKR